VEDIPGVRHHRAILSIKRHKTPGVVRRPFWLESHHVLQYYCWWLTGPTIQPTWRGEGGGRFILVSSKSGWKAMSFLMT